MNYKDETLTKIWSEYIINHFLFKINKYRENYVQSFENLKDCFSYLLEIFKSMHYAPFLFSVLKYYMRNLLYSSQLADQELERKKAKAYCIDDCGRVLMNFFSKYQNDEPSIVFYAVICIIRIYFKLKTYRNSKTLVNWVEISGLDVSRFPKSEVTTFYYYSGRLALYELNFYKALEIFTKAFEMCKSNHVTNKQLIFEYLIVLNLFTGVTPTDDILKHLGLLHYKELIDAYKNGNMTLFEKAIDKLENRLINLGTYLIIEKLKPYVMRNLIKMVYQGYSTELAKLGTPVIKIELIFNVLKNAYLFESMDIEELELYIIGVIYKGLITGYIHNTNKVIVFSKKNPFPKLSETFKSNYNKII
jgi:tetratricopeptide (TPR) repeat protein